MPPDGPVVYVDDAGRVLLGDGAAEPVELAADAALGVSGQGAALLAPTGDLIAYVRSDGALVALPVPIGGVGDPPTVLATDVALDAVGAGPSLAWDPTGVQVAYLAVGTEEMVEPRPDEPPPLSSNIGVFRVPLPEGAIGNVVKIVDRTGAEVVRIGDPSTRSMVGIASSLSDDLLLVESVAPDTGKPYTVALRDVRLGRAHPDAAVGRRPRVLPGRQLHRAGRTRQERTGTGARRHQTRWTGPRSAPTPGSATPPSRPTAPGSSTARARTARS